MHMKKFQYVIKCKSQKEQGNIMNIPIRNTVLLVSLNINNPK